MENTRKCCLCLNDVDAENLCLLKNTSICTICYSELEEMFDGFEVRGVYFSLDSITEYQQGYSLLVNAIREADEYTMFAVYVTRRWKVTDINWIKENMKFYNGFEYEAEQAIKTELEELVLRMKGETDGND